MDTHVISLYNCCHEKHFCHVLIWQRTILHHEILQNTFKQAQESLVYLHELAVSAHTSTVIVFGQTMFSFYNYEQYVVHNH